MVFLGKWGLFPVGVESGEVGDSGECKGFGSGGGDDAVEFVVDEGLGGAVE